MEMSMKKLLFASIALGLISTPVMARDHRHSRGYEHHRHYQHYDRRHYPRRDHTGTAIAAGVLGLVIGSAIANSNRRPINQPSTRYCYTERTWDQYGRVWESTTCE